MGRRVKWVTEGRRRQSEFRDTSPTVSDVGRSPKDPLGQKHGHLLALGYEEENLMPSIRAGVADLFFSDRGL